MGCDQIYSGFHSLLDHSVQTFLCRCSRIFCCIFIPSDSTQTLCCSILILPSSFHFPLLLQSSQSRSCTPPPHLSLSPDGFRLVSWWGWWPVWRLGCLVSRAIRADVALRGRSELSASASPRVTFHGQLVSEQRHARRLSASLIVKINGNQSPHSTLHSLPCSFHFSASKPHSLFPLSSFVASLSLWVFPWCAFAALWLMAAVWQYVIWLFSSLYFTLLSTSVVLKSYNAMKTHHSPVHFYLLSPHYLIFLLPS